VKDLHGIGVVGRRATIDWSTVLRRLGWDGFGLGISGALTKYCNAPNRKTASDDHDSTPEEQFSVPSRCDSDHFMLPNQRRTFPRWTNSGIRNTISSFAALSVLFSDLRI
jgi:hypothetical protein